MRTCRLCKESKPIAEFYFRISGNGKSYPNGCKPCLRAQARKYYHLNPSRSIKRSTAWVRRHRGKYNSTTKAWRHKQRLRVLVLLGNKCVRCGEDDWRCIQIDHVDGGGSQEYRTIGTAGIHRKILKGTKGYRLLCANCNWRKRYEQRESN